MEERFPEKPTTIEGLLAFYDRELPRALARVKAMAPADCAKIGIQEFCPRPPDLVLSGINSGLNAGINVLYSGTVAAAIEGAFFGVTSVAPR